MTAHPILEELSRQLPDAALTSQQILKAAEFDLIATQSRKDIECLENLDGNLEDGQSARAVLEENGYREWLQGSDSDARLRVLGALQLIADLAEELAED